MSCQRKHRDHAYGARGQLTRSGRSAPRLYGAGINFIHLPFNTARPDPAVVETFLKAVTDRKNDPAFIHCASGNRAAASSDSNRLTLPAPFCPADTPRTVPRDCHAVARVRGRRLAGDRRSSGRGCHRNRHRHQRAAWDLSGAPCPKAMERCCSSGRRMRGRARRHPVFDRCRSTRAGRRRRPGVGQTVPADGRVISETDLHGARPR